MLRLQCTYENRGLYAVARGSAGLGETGRNTV